MINTIICLPPPIRQYFDKNLLCPEMEIKERFENILKKYHEKILRMPKRIQKKIQETIQEFEKEYDALQKKKNDDATKAKERIKRCPWEGKTMRFRRYKHEGT